MKNSTNEYTEKLNSLLASYQLHYQNLRSLHWNVKGENFFELHLKYEELYSRAQLIIDDIAERILTLGITPYSRFSDYISYSILAENEIITDGKKGMKYILEAQQRLLELERSILRESDELGDDGTNSFMSDLMREKEKSNWMFRSWLSE
jgi:starvation-inducible DNA-binding protein